ncbi:hypothetical protein WME90_29970 [Sorangium sp. So ce375]|uniref:tetratricopeptide repeat protein n=1 Tax=Sorangium sp. So ce375 TaxID=3133306 RepID=UPI003F5C1B19
MAVQVRKSASYLDELQDWSVEVSRERIEWILADCKRLVRASSASTADIAEAYQVMGHAYARMGRDEDSLSSYTNAARLDPSNPQYIMCTGASLLSLDRPLEALNVFVAAVDRVDGLNKIVMLGNMAEALSDLGQIDDAREVFLEAVRVADFSSPLSVYMLANQAAEIGLDDEAIELFARFLSAKQGKNLGDTPALEFIEAAPEDLRSVLRTPYAAPLSQAISRAKAFGDLKKVVGRNIARCAWPDRGEAADDESAAVFEETRLARMRANSAVLTEDDYAS